MRDERERSQVSVIRAILERGRRGSDLRDWMYGATNGAITTFVIVAGVVGADLPTMVAPVLGLANLFANGFATAARRYTNTKLARDNYNRSHAKAVWAEDVNAKDYDFSRCMRSPSASCAHHVCRVHFVWPCTTYRVSPGSTETQCMRGGDGMHVLCHRGSQESLLANYVVAIRAGHSVSWNVRSCAGLCAPAIHCAC